MAAGAVAGAAVAGAATTAAAAGVAASASGYYPIGATYAALPAGGLLMLMRYLIRLAGLVSVGKWSAMLRGMRATTNRPGLIEPAQ